MESLGWVLTAILMAHVAVCFGKIAAKHGRNPVLYGVFSKHKAGRFPTNEEVLEKLRN